MVVAQLVEQSPPTQEIRGLNLSRKIIEHFSTDVRRGLSSVPEIRHAEIRTWGRRVRSANAALCAMQALATLIINIIVIL